MFIEVEVVIIGKMCINVVVVGLLIDVPIDELVDIFIVVCDDTLVEIGVSDVGIIVVGAQVVVSEFAVTVSCAGDVLAGVVGGVPIDAFSGVLAGVIIFVVSGIGVGALAEVNVELMSAVMNVRIGMSIPSKKPLPCCWTIFRW